MEGYTSTKQKIFANPKKNSTAIIGIDDVHCRHILDFVHYPNIIKISGKEVPENGIGWHENQLIDNRENQFRVIAQNVPKLDGNHNRQNIAAAYAACVANGIESKIFAEGLATFSGLEHRQEFVKSINGAQYINDSKATNADSVEQALKRFDNIIWILGGRPKEDGIESLSPYFSKIKFAFLIGEAAEKWHEFLNKNHVENEVVFDLENAVKKAYKIAQEKGVVLLSPACASFDQFKSFEDRGDQFKKFVEELPC
jgi:UDP-N-acetylmuramoylalanine--D-glutamate ligase